MPHPTEGWDGYDDLARQRRKREERLLDQRLVDSPELTLADIVADVLAASHTVDGTLDIRDYLATGGYHWRTIEAVIGFLQMQNGIDPLAGTPDIQPTRHVP